MKIQIGCRPRLLLLLSLTVGMLSAVPAYSQTPSSFPTPGEIQRAYDEADLNRAVQAYRFFYPTVAFSAGFMSFETIGIGTNQSAAISG